MLIKVIELVNCRCEQANESYDNSLGDSREYGRVEALQDILFELEEL